MKKNYILTVIFVIVVILVAIGIWVFLVQKQANSLKSPITQLPTPVPTKEVEPAIELINLPQEATVGAKINLTWKVEGPSKIVKHTAVHFGELSNPGEFDTTVTPQDSGYPNLTKDYADGTFTIPNTFAASITATRAADLYLRAHVIVDGQNFWTNEEIIKILEGE